jgi:activator of 2-hydroxyglutaryl-CoA dehydratase
LITAGIDIGAKFAKVVIQKDGNVMAKDKALVGFDVLKSASDLFENVLKSSRVSRSDIEHIVATGMGRKAVHLKPPINAEKVVSEVVANAKVEESK